MFFSISLTKHDNFAMHWQVDNIHVDTDNGWNSQQINDRLFIYKGYTDQGKLDQRLESVDHYTLGNFCIIVIDRSLKKIRIVADHYRSFPIYFENGHQVNNLVPLAMTAWTDSILELDFDLTVTEHKFDAIGPIDSKELSYESALDWVHAILTDRTRHFLRNNTLPLKVFLSGGVDTLLVYSYLKNAGAELELVDYEHLEHDYFWRENDYLIKRNWGYKQLHHWRQPCVLASGAPGDEFMLRSPTTANMYLSRHNTSIPQLLEQHPDCLHHSYFSRYMDLYKTQQQTEQDTSDWALCNILINDWQHWHLGNTLTWTPLRDLRIIKIMLRMPVSHAIDQIINSEFSKCLIERNAPGVTQFISDQKNAGPVLKNLNRLFC